jgi:hypothetical protein
MRRAAVPAWANCSNAFRSALEDTSSRRIGFIEGDRAHELWSIAKVGEGTPINALKQCRCKVSSSTTSVTILGASQASTVGTMSQTKANFNFERSVPEDITSEGIIDIRGDNEQGSQWRGGGASKTRGSLQIDEAGCWAAASGEECDGGAAGCDGEKTCLVSECVLGGDASISAKARKKKAGSFSKG